jgi:hypothetical protein
MVRPADNNPVSAGAIKTADKVAVVLLYARQANEHACTSTSPVTSMALPLPLPAGSYRPSYPRATSSGLTSNCPPSAGPTLNIARTFSVQSSTFNYVFSRFHCHPRLANCEAGKLIKYGSSASVTSPNILMILFMAQTAKISFAVIRSFLLFFSLILVLIYCPDRNIEFAELSRNCLSCIVLANIICYSDGR